MKRGGRGRPFGGFSRMALIAAALAGPCRLDAAAASASAPKRPRIGLVLSGGGARGTAHVGVLKVLEEMRIPVDFIAGTSMGSAVGGLYASGLSAADLGRIFEKFNWYDSFNDSPPREERSFRRKEDDQNSLVKYGVGIGANGVKLPLGAVEGQNFITELRKLGHITQDLPSFDLLPTPFRALASDLVTGESVVLSSGDLALAIRSSVAIPPLFAPMKYQGRLLADGGFLNNIPVDVARGMGADALIVVNIGTPLMTRDNIGSMFDVLSQTGRLGGTQFDRRQLSALTDRDLLIEPDLEGLSFVDFDKVPEMMKRGEAKARALAGALKRYSVSEEEYAAWKAGRPGAAPWPVVTAIVLRNQSRIKDGILAPFITQPLNAPLDPAKLQKDLAGIYGLGCFEYVDYNVVESSSGATLIVNAPHKSWGPNYLRFGVRFTENFSGESSYLLTARHTMTELNRMGGEFQTELGVGSDSHVKLEYYQPFLYGTRRYDRGAAYFFSPVLHYERKTQDITVDGQQMLIYRFNTLRTGGDLGLQFGNWGELRGGLMKEITDPDLRVGPKAYEAERFDDAYMRAGFRYDTLDQVAFPRRGRIGAAEWRRTVPALGTNFDYQTLDLTAQEFWPWKKSTFSLRGVYSTNLDRRTAHPHPYNLGEFLFLSGFKENGMIGTERVLGQFQCYYEMGRVSGSAWYLGAVAEAGRTRLEESQVSMSSSKAAGSVFLGVDSFFGPLYLAYSVVSDGRTSTAFLLGSRY